jgi:hypothetical protein
MWARLRDFIKCGIAIATTIPRIMIVIMISIKVKPPQYVHIRLGFIF